MTFKRDDRVIFRADTNKPDPVRFVVLEFCPATATTPATAILLDYLDNPVLAEDLVIIKPPNNIQQ